MGQSSIYISKIKTEDQLEQKESQVHNITIVPSASTWSIVVDNLSCETFTPRRIVVDLMKPSHKVGNSLSTKVSNYSPLEP